MIEYSHSSIKRFSMELGGDAPVLIFADVTDIKSVLADVVGLKFANAGQICVSPNRVYVQEEVSYKASPTSSLNLAFQFSVPEAGN